MENDKYLLSSLSHALDILDLLNDYEELSLAQILKHMNISKAAAFRLLLTLESKNYVVKS
ncbi:MAG: helix-turn-helix domain-containing protein, partial [Eubacteriaceae bacterium]|nr:helix-turn-helix domain-containing protein [Eubacteriaceae bacterium]